jgi:hypothetical protein
MVSDRNHSLNKQRAEIAVSIFENNHTFNFAAARSLGNQITENKDKILDDEEPVQR